LDKPLYVEFIELCFGILTAAIKKLVLEGKTHAEI
jgi:hypothetical protein